MSEYFDLHTQGIGYLNRIREVRTGPVFTDIPKKGQSIP